MSRYSIDMDNQKIVKRVSERIEKELGIKPVDVHFGCVLAVHEPGEPEEEEHTEFYVNLSNDWDFEPTREQIRRVAQIAKEEGVKHSEMGTLARWL